MTTILLWNDDFGMAPTRLVDCADECVLTRDRERSADADAVVFHVPTMRERIDQLPKPPRQRWVAWSMESDVNYPRLADPAFLRHFDLTMTYRRDADVWVPYVDASLAAPGDRWVDAGAEPALAVDVASNPSAPSERDAYVRELMHHMPVDAYGRCLQNRTWPEDHGRTTKLETYTRYRFTLAFENSISADYVTEKFFDPLVAGSVPVYLGAPNVADFAPGEHCFVDVTDFSGPQALAAHLVELDHDDTAYRQHHAWRSGPVRPEYAAMLARTRANPFCRLARLLATS
jgi:hypothetical protein